MSVSTTRPGGRLRGLRRVGAFLAIASVIATLAVAAFNWGLMKGLAAGGGLLIAYSVPAIYFDWPRVTLSNVADFLSYIGELISSFFSWLFD